MRIPRRVFAGGIVGLTIATAACDRNPQPPNPVPSAEPVDAGPSLFTADEYDKGVTELISKAGKPVHALKLVVFSDRLVLHAQVAGKPTHVDQYIYRGGRVEEPVPVKLKGAGTLEDNLFPLSEANLDAVPELVRRAVTASAVEQGEVSRVVLKRALPKKRDIEFRVHVSGPRKDGFVKADKDGKLLEQDGG